jgi:predicted aspartyl protease
MRIEKFKRANADSLIIIKGSLPNHQISLAIDTGASHTTIDLTALLIAGLEVKDSLRIEKLETASGIIEAYVFRVQSFTALGITKYNVEVCAYDFFAHNVLTEFDGVLGVDFLSAYKICIDFIKSEITLQ